MIGHIGTGKKRYTFLNAVKEAEFLKANPLCVCCQREGKYKKATVVWIYTNGDIEARCEDHARGKVL